MAGLWVEPLSYRAWEDGRSGLRTNGLAGAASCGTSCGRKQHRQREMSSVINATKFKTLSSFEIISNVKLQKFPTNAAGSSPRAAAVICHVTSSSLAQLKSWSLTLMISPTSSSAWQNQLSRRQPSQDLQPRPPASVRWGSFRISFTAALSDTLTYEEYRLVYSGPSGGAKFCILSPFHYINAVLLGSIIGNANFDNWVYPISLLCGYYFLMQWINILSMGKKFESVETARFFIY